MEIKKLDDSKVDEIIKKSEKAAMPCCAEHATGEKSILAKKPERLLSTLVIFILLALSLIQSVELINLRKQIQSGQFGAAAAPATGGSQGLPSQQGGC